MSNKKILMFQPSKNRRFSFSQSLYMWIFLGNLYEESLFVPKFNSCGVFMLTKCNTQSSTLNKTTPTHEHNHSHYLMLQLKQKQKRVTYIISWLNIDINIRKQSVTSPWISTKTEKSYKHCL